MRCSFDLNTIELVLSAPSKNVAWIPTVPAMELKAYKGKRIEVSPEYLRSAVSEMKRYHANLAERGVSYRRPILCNHDDAGRRSGDLLDFAVRPYQHEKELKETLFIKGDFLDEAWAAIRSKKLKHGSISILPEYTDPESGETYAPFIKEWSETHSPVVKGFTVDELIESPEQLAALNLTLSEGEPAMTPEEIEALLAKVGEVVEAQITAALEPIVERLDALDGGEEEEKEEEKTEEPAAPAEGEKVAASDSNVVSFEDILARFDSLESKIDRQARARAKGGQKSATGVPIVASDATKKPKKVPVEKQLEQIKEETGLRGIAAVKARQAREAAQ